MRFISPSDEREEVQQDRVHSTVCGYFLTEKKSCERIQRRPFRASTYLCVLNGVQLSSRINTLFKNIFIKFCIFCGALIIFLVSVSSSDHSCSSFVPLCRLLMNLENYQLTKIFPSYVAHIRICIFQSLFSFLYL